MKKYSSLDRSCKLTPVELANLCELFASGELNVFQLARKYDLAVDTVNKYLYTHYYGIVPKHKQITITIKDQSDE